MSVSYGMSPSNFRHIELKPWAEANNVIVPANISTAAARKAVLKIHLWYIQLGLKKLSPEKAQARYSAALTEAYKYSHSAGIDNSTFLAAHVFGTILMTALCVAQITTIL